MTIWSLDRNFKQYKKVLIALHGCPSHPFDHIPYNFHGFFESGYIVVCPHYYGTWGSDGVCDFNNCIDTIVELIALFKKKSLVSTFDNSEISLQDKSIILFGASFGGYVALSAGAENKYIQDIIACSPIIDWENHNANNDEADLAILAKELADSYTNLRRCSKTGLSNLSDGKLRYKKDTLLKKLCDKNILIIHGDNDPQVKSYKSEQFVLELKKIGKGKHIYAHIEDGGHILLHHASKPKIQPYISNFLEG